MATVAGQSATIRIRSRCKSVRLDIPSGAANEGDEETNFTGSVVSRGRQASSTTVRRSRSMSPESYPSPPTPRRPSLFSGRATGEEDDLPPSFIPRPTSSAATDTLLSPRDMLPPRPRSTSPTPYHQRAASNAGMSEESPAPTDFHGTIRICPRGLNNIAASTEWGSTRMCPIGAGPARPKSMTLQPIEKIDQCVRRMDGEVKIILPVCDDMVWTPSPYGSINICQRRMGVLAGRINTGVITALVEMGNSVIAGSSEGGLAEYDAHTGKLLAQSKKQRVGQMKDVNCLCATIDKLYSGSSDGKIRKWDYKTMSVTSVVLAHKGAVRCLVVNKGVLHSGGDDRCIRTWDLETDTCIATWEGHSASISGMALFGDKIWSADGKNNVRVWNATNGHHVVEIKGAGHRLTVIGTYVWIGHTDGSIHIYDAETYRHVKTLWGHQKQVTALATVGNYVWSTSKDETTIIWAAYEDMEDEMTSDKQRQNQLVRYLQLMDETLDSTLNQMKDVVAKCKEEHFSILQTLESLDVRLTAARTVQALKESPTERGELAEALCSFHSSQKEFAVRMKTRFEGLTMSIVEVLEKLETEGPCVVVRAKSMLSGKGGGVADTSSRLA